MRASVLLLLVVVLHPDVEAAAAGKVVLQAVDLARTHSWRRNAVDWPAVDEEMRPLAAAAKTPADAYAAIRRLFVRLGDNHSFAVSSETTPALDREAAARRPPAVKLVGERFGYVEMTTAMGLDAATERAYVTRTHAAISRLEKAKPCGWIVDLRANHGGNMWPMLAALQPFLGHGAVGSTDPDSSGSGPWRAGDRMLVPMPSRLAVLSAAPVAVLTGRGTASAGEAVAIAFRGRPSTRSFGQPTSGHSTATRTFPLRDGSKLVLATSVMVDRAGNHFGGSIEPDARIDDPAAVFQAGVDWLARQPPCAAAAP